MMSEPITTITITYELPDDGSDPLVRTDFEREVGVLTLLGMVELARDSILNAPDDDAGDDV